MIIRLYREPPEAGVILFAPMFITAEPAFRWLKVMTGYSVGHPYTDAAGKRMLDAYRKSTRNAPRAVVAAGRPLLLDLAGDYYYLDDPGVLDSAYST